MATRVTRKIRDQMANGRSSRRTAFVVAALIAVASAVFVASAFSAAASAACPPKTTKIGGKTAVVFCGSAKSTARAAGKSFSFRSGTCVRQGSSTFFLQMGTIGGPTAPSGLQSRPLFYLLADPSKLSTTQSLLYWIVDGKRYSAAPGTHVTFSPSRASGTFSGKLARGSAGSGAFTGSFTC
jgi:hypothetical protein